MMGYVPHEIPRSGPMQIETWFVKRKSYIFFKGRAHAISHRDIGYVYIACSSRTRYRVENFVKVDDNYEHKCEECLKIVANSIAQRLKGSKTYSYEEPDGGTIIRK